MFQEIITYLIVALAVFLAFKKIRQKLSRPKKKKLEESTAGQSGATSNCDNCAADCIFRDSPESVIKKNPDACQKNA